MREIKGRTEDKVLMASGAVTPPADAATDISIGVVAAILLGALVVASLAVIITAPFWFLHS